VVLIKMTVKEDLGLIENFQKEMNLIGRAGGLLDWDEQVLMPPKGIGARSEGSALLSSIAHEKMTSNDFFSAVLRLRKSRLKGKDEIMVKKLHKDIMKSRKLPKEFVGEMSRATTLGSSAWREARRRSKFGVFKPHLERIIKLKRKEAEYVGYDGHPYNALLDDYEEGMTAEKLKRVFGSLKEDVVSLLRNIEDSEVYRKKRRKMMKGIFPREKQMMFVHDVAGRMGMEKDKSRIDFSEHPFTIKIGVDDVRVTTNIRKDPMFSFGSTIHEAGHALYELGMPEQDAYNVLGDSPSMGLHESQSRFWENMIGKNKPFWRYYFPRYKREFGLRGSFDDWFREVNFVSPGKIRIESDEVHYCLHVILRFEAELGLLEGSLKVKDLPKFWSGKMKEFFGVSALPKNDVEGCMQDVHWSGGSVGYFPTYAIGTMYAAQLYGRLIKEKKGIEGQIARGKFDNVRKWLNDKVHMHGSKYLAEDVIKKVCGEGLNPDVYVSYLRRKYEQIYRF
jgi:carboxypeptidase Taq